MANDTHNNPSSVNHDDDVTGGFTGDSAGSNTSANNTNPGDQSGRADSDSLNDLLRDMDASDDAVDDAADDADAATNTDATDDDDVDDDTDTDDLDNLDAPNQQDELLNLAGANLSHTLTDEAGTRLDLSDIHGGTLKPTDLSEEMKASFLEYSMSVIVARALPDVRDGLKPVHRRILYAMNEAHIVPSRPHKKSAWTVGEVMGKYHPHGDSSIYEAMVRMAQDFSMRLPLIDGHGNFGSIDGDPAAAMRYTESRLTHAAMDMLRDLDKETVDLQPNYDESLQEPAVLPARFPNLLVNGSNGIAVGMATNVPPHNLQEVARAVCCMIDNPNSTLEDLMACLPGPDFPTGGIIMGTDGIKDAYKTGRGTLTIRSKVHIENTGRAGRQRLVITEIPYQVNKSLLQERIAQQVNEKKIEGISDMRDESNRKGMRIVIDLKQGAVPQVVLNNLYKRTQLQTSFSVIDIALVDGVPRTLSLHDMIRYYIKHQQDVVTRRTKFDLARAQKRVHILEGLLIAVDNIDEVVHIIRSSKDDAEAKSRMSERFGIDDIQGEAILQMRLRRLTGLARDELAAQIDELYKQIAYLTDLLQNPEKMLEVIKEELMQIAERYASPRRTKISTNEAQILDVEDLITEEDMVITVTHSSYIKRLPVATYRAQKRGGKGVQGLSLKDNDFVEDLFVASTHDYVLFFTNKGKVYRLKVHELPVGSRTSRGSALVNVLPLAEDEHPTAVITTRDFPDNQYLVFATKQGMVKKTAIAEYDKSRRDGLIAINLKDGDELVNVRRVCEGNRIILCTSAGKAIMFSEEDVRPTSRNTSGVKGISLKNNAYMLGMEISNGKGDLLVITENGYGKRTPISEYSLQHRGGQGVTTIAMTSKKGALVACRVVGPQHELMIMSEEGVMIRVKSMDISSSGRATQGVKIMNLSSTDHVSAMARMVAKKKSSHTQAADKNQPTLPLAFATAPASDADPAEADEVNIGGEEEFDENLIDDDE